MIWAMEGLGKCQRAATTRWGPQCCDQGVDGKWPEGIGLEGLTGIGMAKNGFSEERESDEELVVKARNRSEIDR